MKTDARDLARWKTGAAPIDGLSDALVALSNANAGDAELERLRGALATQLAAPTRSVADGSSAGALSWWTWSRVWPWLSVVALGASLWTVVTHDSQPARRNRAAEVQRPIAAPKASASTAAIAPALDASPSLSPVPTAAPSSPRSTTKRKASVPAQVAGPALTPETELLLLRKAQSALNRSASAALALADEHAQLYPNGVFVEEREMLRIEAELTLGKRREALARAHAFSERFGRSTYRARIDRLLASQRALKVREAPTPASTQ